MKGTILLNYDENVHKVEDEEKARFLRSFLEQCFESAPDIAEQVAAIWNVDGPLPVAQKVKLRGILTTYGIQIIDNLDGCLLIYIENEKVAEWHKPAYKLKKAAPQKDRRKNLYIEMNIEYWSVFEETENSDG